MVSRPICICTTNTFPVADQPSAMNNTHSNLSCGKTMMRRFATESRKHPPPTHPLIPATINHPRNTRPCRTPLLPETINYTRLYPYLYSPLCGLFRLYAVAVTSIQWRGGHLINKHALDVRRLTAKRCVMCLQKRHRHLDNFEHNAQESLPPPPTRPPLIVRQDHRRAASVSYTRIVAWPPPPPTMVTIAITCSPRRVSARS